MASASIESAATQLIEKSPTQPSDMSTSPAVRSVSSREDASPSPEKSRFEDESHCADALTPDVCSAGVDDQPGDNDQPDAAREWPIECRVQSCRVWTLGSDTVEAEIERFGALSKLQRQHGVLKALSDSVRRQPPRKKRRIGRRKRVCFTYRVAGVEACRSCFQRVNGISQRGLQTLQGRVSNDRLGFRLHYGNNRRPSKQFTTQLLGAQRFIDSFIEDNCVPCPDTAPGFDGMPVMILPLHFSPKVIFGAYKRACDGTPLGRTRFNKERKKIFRGRVRLETRKTAYCQTCSTYSDRKRAHVNTAEEDAEFSRHRDFFMSAREQYNSTVQEAKRSAMDALTSGGTRDMSHLSFDYAAPFILPKVNVQVSADYFQTMVGVSMFGVVDEGTNQQKTYLFPEGKCPELDRAGSASAQAVCSLLAHAILSMPKTRHLVLQADNCSSQNKNNYMLKFCMMLIEKGIVELIDLRFMAVGHTKFSPDRHFGSIKTAAKTKRIYSFDELVLHVEENRFCETVTTFDWQAFKPFLQNLIPGVFPGVKSFYRFEIRKGFEVTAFKGYPLPNGVVGEPHLLTPVIKKFNVNPNRAETIRGSWPQILPPAGLSTDRRRALLHDVAPIYPGLFEEFVTDLVRQCDEFGSAANSSHQPVALPTESSNVAVDNPLPLTSAESAIFSGGDHHESSDVQQPHSTSNHTDVDRQSPPVQTPAPSCAAVWCSPCKKYLSSRRTYNVHVKTNAHQTKVSLSL